MRARKQQRRPSKAAATAALTPLKLAPLKTQPRRRKTVAVHANTGKEEAKGLATDLAKGSVRA